MKYSAWCRIRSTRRHISNSLKPGKYIDRYVWQVVDWYFVADWALFSAWEGEGERWQTLGQTSGRTEEALTNIHLTNKQRGDDVSATNNWTVKISHEIRTCFPCVLFNSQRLGDANMPHWTGSSLVHVIACRIFGAKPLSEPMRTNCQFDPLEHSLVTFYWN